MWCYERKSSGSLYKIRRRVNMREPFNTFWLICVLAVLLVGVNGVTIPSTNTTTTSTTTTTTPVPTTTTTPVPTTTTTPVPTTTTTTPVPTTTTTTPVPTTTTTPVPTTTTTPVPTITSSPISTPNPLQENGCQSLNTTMDTCNFNHYVTINATSPCVFSCTYHMKNLSPLLLEVHLNYSQPQKTPAFVTAQQTNFIHAWTLPIIFPNHRDSQPFTSISNLLCPPTITQIAQETVQVSITTDSTDDISMKVGLNSRPYVLKMGDSVTMKASPVSPNYRLYQWTKDESSVLVSAESINKSATVCSILAIQNAKCPVFTDEAGLRAGGGRFQTFTTSAGIVATRSQYPDGVHMIFWPLPDDDPCTLFGDSVDNRTSRQKSVRLQVFTHSTIASTWYIFLITGSVIAAVLMGLTIVSVKVIDRSLGLLSGEVVDMEEDERVLLEDDDRPSRSTRRAYAEGGMTVLGGANSGLLSSGDSRRTQDASASGAGPSRGDPYVGSGLFEGSIGSIHSGSDETSMLPVIPGNPPAYAPPTTYAPHTSVLNFTRHNNPVYVLWWKRYAVFESRTAEAQVAEMGFQNNLLIMAVFAALPTSELIRSYLKMLSYHGDEDQCFFNSRCLTALWPFHDFSRVFTNIGYILSGLAFTRIVIRHRFHTQRILDRYSAENSVGVSRHYGLFFSLGYGLIIQGIMSSLYHMCPNSVTIRFDMMFMFVMSIAAVISIWGLRHGDVTHHVYPTMGLVGTTLLLAEGRQWVSRLAFWSFMSIFYALLLLTTTVLMARYGLWSFSPLKVLRVWKGWKPVTMRLADIIKDDDRTSTPLQIVRIAFGVLANVALILYGAIADPNVYKFILVICLTNLGLYLGHYVLTKRICFRERGTIFAWICIFVSLVLWILALTAFQYHSTDSESSASDSRALNTPCVFFDVFDAHDAWHLMSSLALFTFFIGLLTLDDDMCQTPSKLIHVF